MGPKITTGLLEMLDEKRMGQVRERVKDYLKRGDIQKSGDGRFVKFFLENSGNSFDSAKLLFRASTDKEFMTLLGLEGFNGLLWVVNASYYSMFYTARALLESEGIRLKAESASIHLLTFDALVHYFYLSGKLQKRLLEQFVESQEEASQTLWDDKARRLLEDYFYEKKKRGLFTYEMGAIAMKGRAQTSLDRARSFNEEIRKILEAR